MNARRDKSTLEWLRVYAPLFLFVLSSFVFFFFFLREWDTNSISVWMKKIILITVDRKKMQL